MNRYLILLFISITICSAGERDFPDYIAFYSPGIKIGYEFGKYPGFTLGSEININLLKIKTVRWTGINIGFECNMKQKKWKLRQEFLYGHYFGGVGIGAEYYDKKFSFCSRIIAYGYFGSISYKPPFFGTYSQWTLTGHLPFLYMAQYGNDKFYNLYIGIKPVN